LSVFFAIPFFNQAGFLEATLKSLIQQTDRNWRAVVFDDSVDGAESEGAKGVVQRLNDSRIVYRRNEKNLGLALNWNQAFSFGSDSPLVGILHADDELTSEYVAKVKRASEEIPDATAFFTKTEIIDHRGDRVFSFPDFYKKFLLPAKVHDKIHLKGEAGLNSVLRGNFIFCPTLCFRSSKMEGIRFDPGYRMVLDLDLICRILLRGDLMVGLYSEPLYRYRRHATNATNILTRNMVRFVEERDLYRELAKNLSARGFTKAAGTARRMRVIRLNLAFQILKSICGFRWGAARGFANFLLKEL
jgi:glycosyltransferase involved in cell wall biosynthesis